jgi:tetratricopeptide (TPR) repeat protein
MKKIQKNYILISAGMLILLIISVVWLLKSSSDTPDKTIAPDDGAWRKLTVSAVEAMKAGKAAEAEKFGQEAMKLLRNSGKEDMRMVKTYMLMGEIYRWDKNPGQAEEFYQQAVALCRNISGSDHPDMIIPLEALANFYYYTSINHKKVAELYKEILDIAEKRNPKDETEIAIRAVNLGDIYQLLNEYEKAEPLYQKALSLAEKRKELSKADYLLSSAGFYCSWGKCDTAVSLAKQLLEIREEAARNNTGVDVQLDLVTSLDLLGQIYLKCKDPQQAEVVYSRSVKILEKNLGSQYPDLVQHLTGFASSLFLQKKYKQAELEYKRALELAEKNFGQGSPETASVLQAYVALLKETGKIKEVKVMEGRIEAVRKAEANAEK